MHPVIPYFQSIRLELILPEFLSGRHLTVYGFGIAVAAGLIIGHWIALRRVTRLGLDVLVMHQATACILLGVVVGGHIGYGLLYHPQAYLADPRLFLDFSHGLSSVGGFFFSNVALILLFRFHKQPYWPYADSIAIGLSFGWFLGRVGCTLNHEHLGAATHFFLGRYCRPVEGYTLQWPAWMSPHTPDLRFGPCIESGQAAVTRHADQVAPNFSGVVAVHDTGLYEAIFALCLFLLFVWLDRKPRFPGFFILLMAALYAPVRFALDFLRLEEGNPRSLGLTPAQWGMLVMAFAALWGLRRLGRTPR